MVYCVLEPELAVNLARRAPLRKRLAQFMVSFQSESDHWGTSLSR